MDPIKSISDSGFGKQLALLATALVIAFMVYMRLFSNRHPIEDAYLKSQVNARVTIAGYEHDVPMVIPKYSTTQTPVALFTPTLCNRYLMDNDSVIKASNSNFLTVIRDSGEFQVTTTWVMYKDYYTKPLVDRKIVNKTATKEKVNELSE